MSRTTKAAASIVALLLVLTALATVHPGVAQAAEPTLDEPTADEPTPDEPTADEPITTLPDSGDARGPAAGADAAGGEPLATESATEAGSNELTAGSPVTDDSAATPRTKRVPVVPPRDPRRLDFRGCRLNVLTCAIARQHQADGYFMWQGGKVFLTVDGRRVQGHRAHTWRAYQRQARRLAAYLRAVDQARLEQQRRQALVLRWAGVASCETGGRWGLATGNGYYGGLQFSLSTWRAAGGQGYPHQQPAWYQAQIAERLRLSSGLHHWPHCGANFR